MKTTTAENFLTSVNGVQVFWDNVHLTFIAGLTVDGDGANGQGGKACYHPLDVGRTRPPFFGLDDPANAGFPDHWGEYQDCLVCRPNGVAMIQKGNTLDEATERREPFQPCKGAFISRTSLIWSEFPDDDVRRYIDAASVPYVVLPRQLRYLIAPILLGCKAEVWHEGHDHNIIEAVVADLGPATHLGEGSVALAHALGEFPDPRMGGTADRIYCYRITPGEAANVDGVVYRLQAMRANQVVL